MSLLLYKKKKQLGNTVSIRSAVQQNRIGTTVLFWATLLIEKPPLEQSHADETFYKNVTFQQYLHTGKTVTDKYFLKE